MIYLLALYPDVCRRLRGEVLETFGPTGTPTYERLKKMDYCAFYTLINRRLALRY